MDQSILNPDGVIKLSNNESVTVKLLKWKTALEFFRKLNLQFKAFQGENGQVVFSQAKIMEAIQGNAELLEWLVLQCTGKESAFLDSLDLGDMTKLAVKSLEINLAVIADEIKNVKGRLAALTAGGQTSKSNPTLPNSATP